MLDNFVKTADIPTEVIEKYREILPEMFINFWEKFGIASGLGGYLKSVNPEDLSHFVATSFVLGEGAIPIFVTAFGDVLAMTNYGGEYRNLYMIRYKDGYGQIMLGAGKHFFKLLDDPYFLSKYFELDLYQEAVKQLGELTYNQCFGFVPLLALGGEKSVSHMDKVGVLEHLELMTQLTGGVGLE